MPISSLVARRLCPRFAVFLAALLPAFLFGVDLRAQQLDVSALLAPIVDNPKDARYADVAAAIEQFQQGDVEGAHTLLSEAVSKVAEIPPADTMVGRLYFMIGQPAAGRGALEAATTEAPNDPEAYLLLGDLALAEGRLTEAYLLYSTGEDLCAAYDKNARRKRLLQIGAYSGMSRAAAERFRWDDVARALSAWLKLDPKSVVAQMRWARMLFHTGKFDQAYALFQKVYEQDSGTPRPEVSMAMLYEELVQAGDASKRDSARRAMQAAVQADPDTLATRLAAARWALGACQLDMAAENAEAALKLDPESVEARLLSGLVARHRGDAAKARSLFEAAHLQSPGDPFVLGQLALALLEQREPQAQAQALEYARLAVAASTDRGAETGRTATTILAWALFENGRQSDAAQTLQAAVQSGPLGDEDSYFAAVILNAAGQPSAALRLLEPVLRSGRCFPSRPAAESLLEKLHAARP